MLSETELRDIKALLKINHELQENIFLGVKDKLDSFDQLEFLLNGWKYEFQQFSTQPEMLAKLKNDGFKQRFQQNNQSLAKIQTENYYLTKLCDGLEEGLKPVQLLKMKTEEDLIELLKQYERTDEEKAAIVSKKKKELSHKLAEEEKELHHAKHSEKE